MHQAWLNVAQRDATNITASNASSTSIQSSTCRCIRKIPGFASVVKRYAIVRGVRGRKIGIVIKNPKGDSLKDRKYKVGRSPSNLVQATQVQMPLKLIYFFQQCKKKNKIIRIYSKMTQKICRKNQKKQNLKLLHKNKWPSFLLFIAKLLKEETNFVILSSKNTRNASQFLNQERKVRSKKQIIVCQRQMNESLLTLNTYQNQFYRIRYIYFFSQRLIIGYLSTYLNMNHSDHDLVKKEAFDEQQELDSEDSSWSQIQKPGSSYLDRLIKERDRFNLHYHKEDIVNIPETNRIPLLPDEENYDWIEERKLMSIKKVGQTKMGGIKYNRKLMDKQHELELKDPALTSLYDQWEKMSENEKGQLRRRQSLSVLEEANKQKTKKETIKDFRIDSFWYNRTKLKRKQGRPSKESIKLQVKLEADEIFEDLCDEQIQINDQMSQQECSNSFSFGRKRQQ